MTDQTRQLIAELRDGRNDFPSYLHSLCRVAADEIERLENDLKIEKEISSWNYNCAKVGKEIEEQKKRDPFAPVSPESAIKADWP